KTRRAAAGRRGARAMKIYGHLLEPQLAQDPHDHPDGKCAHVGDPAVRLEKHGRRFSYYSTAKVLGTPQDIRPQEIRIELQLSEAGDMAVVAAGHQAAGDPDRVRLSADVETSGSRPNSPRR